MHYVYLTNNIVTDQAQIDPFKVFFPDYASQFIEAPDEVTFDWKLENGEWVAPPPPDYTEINKQRAMALLQETDWVALNDVSNTDFSPHLVNIDDFNNYRLALRLIAIDPPSEPAVFPIKPEEVWSTESL
jgi:hypothetical protein